MNISQLIKDCITGIDGQSVDVGRLLWIAGAITFLVLSVYHAYKHGTFDPLSYGTGYGGVLAGGGAGIGMKAHTEPLGTDLSGRNT